MALITSKHGKREFTVKFTDLTGGINFSQSPELIGDNELTSALNFIVDPYSGRLRKRNGLRSFCTALGGSPFSSEITGLYIYNYTSSPVVRLSSRTKYLVGLTGQTMFYVNLSTGVATSMGSCDHSEPPTFATFGTKLLMANGNLYLWDRTTFTNLTDTYSAPSARKVFVKDSRVYTAGDLVYPHRIQSSGPREEYNWDTVNAVSFYWDIDDKHGEGINGVGVLGNDIVIFKGTHDKGMYRLIIDPLNYDTSEVKELSRVHSCVNFRSVMPYANNLFFLDYDGFHSVVGVTQYGDLALDPTGKKINQGIAVSMDPNYAFLDTFPFYNTMFLNVNDDNQIFAYNIATQGFLPWRFTQVRISAMAYDEETRYLYMALYFLDGTTAPIIVKYDTTSYLDNFGSDMEYPAFMTTKRIINPSSFVKKLLKQTLLVVENEQEGTFTVEAITDNGNTTTTVMDQALTGGKDLLFNATGLLYAATDYLYEGDRSILKSSRDKVRCDDVQFRITNNKGALSFNYLEARLASVGRN